MNIPLYHSRALQPLRNFAAACALAALLSGCPSTGTEGLVSSTAPPEISGPAASAIAGDSRAASEREPASQIKASAKRRRA
ncbi:hypothetical protein ABID16_004687 [Rhizobium aquaticum]|uniref:Uncharacterized protein n=1 Tax=Rhizobium aquaticum TaxID=1549636 RepID=A0ABV2J6R8_9HYPH